MRRNQGTWESVKAQTLRNKGGNKFCWLQDGRRWVAQEEWCWHVPSKVVTGFTTRCGDEGKKAANWKAAPHVEKCYGRGKVSKIEDGVAIIGHLSHPTREEKNVELGLHRAKVILPLSYNQRDREKRIPLGMVKDQGPWRS